MNIGGDKVMRILITAAEQEELDCAINGCRALGLGPEFMENFTFRLTGIGSTQACHTVTREIWKARLEGKPLDLVVNIGIAGSYDMEAFPLGSAAVIDREYFGDLGFDTSRGFMDLFQCGILGKDTLPYTGGALKRSPIPHEGIEKALARYRGAAGVTVQTVTGDPAKVKEIYGRYTPQIESMEGAAVYFASIMEDVPFFELRTVSNEVGERDRKKWDIPAALRTLEECCKEIFGTIAQ